jgi:uncharacterized protein YndB with AHSA1/START domain
MTTTTKTNVNTLMFRVYIKASAEAIWEAITDPEWNQRYGYQTPADYDLRPGGAYRAVPSPAMAEFGAPEVIIEGEVLESDPPRRLVQTWHALFNPEAAAEGFTRVTWEIDEQAPGINRLTVTHELEGAPASLTLVSGATSDAGGGWSWILSDLKSLLETGQALAG